MSVDVVVIGAGVAGLSAAAALRDAGLDCVVLEAGSRVGGRAWTVDLQGAPVDLGASWLHNAADNPLTEIAKIHGETLVSADGARERRRHIGGRRATEAELADFDATWEAFSDLASARALSGPDVSIAEAVAELRERPWAATVMYWEACLIAAADPRRLSVRDWHANLLEGQNLEIRGGIGAFVARRLAGPAGNIRLATPATRVAWSGPGGRVRVETPDGTVTADACVVTVSTGVLAGGGIVFDPPLPVATQKAIDGLPMGLLTKLALPARGADRLGLPSTCSLQSRVAVAEEPMMSLLCWPFGRPHIVGFVGGPGAWALAADGPGAVEDFARAQLRGLLGADADRALGPGMVSNWADDVEFRGSYAFATTGNAGARAALGVPVGDGHLVFAGEAVCADGLAGTVGGAWLSGRRAARIVADTLATRVDF
jgi:monoamine oxidase